MNRNSPFEEVIHFINVRYLEELHKKWEGKDSNLDEWSDFVTEFCKGVRNRNNEPKD